MSLHVRDDRYMRSLTGVSLTQFEILLEAFTTTHTELQWQALKLVLVAGTRQRRPGGGKKGALPTMRDKLLFLLYYFKVYPTFDVLGAQFSMARSKANENLHKLTPILYQTLVHLEVMPHRKFTSPDEKLEALDGIDTILINVTERNHRRPRDNHVDHKIIRRNARIAAVKKATHTQKYSDFYFGQNDSLPGTNLCWSYS